MIRPMVLANALATVVGAGYILCRLIAAIAPEFLFSVGQSWLHTVNLAPLRTTSPMPAGMFLLGLGLHHCRVVSALGELRGPYAWK